MPPDTTAENHDADIVLALQQDTNEGLRLLLRECGGKARNYLRRRYDPMLDEHQLEEALLDAAMKVADTYDPDKGKPLGGWLIFLADREAINILRREERHYRNRVQLPDFDGASSTDSPEDALEADEFCEQLSDVLQRRLSELERKVITADMDEGRTVNANELAQRFQTDTGSIYAARVRARRKLAKWLASTVC